MTSQNLPKICPQCGAALPAGALEGLCPACLLKSTPPSTPSTPSPAGVAACQPVLARVAASCFIVGCLGCLALAIEETTHMVPEQELWTVGLGVPMIFIECGLGLALILGLMSWHERLGRVITISSVGLMALAVAAVVSSNMRHQAQAISYVQPSPPPVIQPAPSPVIQPTPSPAIQPTPGTGIPQPETPDQETSLVIQPNPAPVVQRNSALRVQSFPGFRRQPPEVSGVVEDHAGNDNGAILGGVSFVSGKLGRAFQFDGQGAQIDFGPTAGNVGTSDFTIDYWMNTPNNPSSGIEVFLNNRAACGEGNFLDITVGHGNPVSPGLLQIVLRNNGVGDTFLTGVNKYNDGQWHHVAWVRRANPCGSTCNLLLYVDGMLNNSSSSVPITDIHTTTHLEMGQDPCTAGPGPPDHRSPYGGAVDELDIWNRALSDLEISDIYQSGLDGKKPTASGLIHSWSAQNGSLAPDSL